MKTKLIYIVPLLTVLFSCAQEVIISENEIKEDLLYLDNSLSPYSGKCTVVYHNTGLKKEVFIFNKGQLNGESTGFYENGNIKWKGNYTKGHISGNWQFWDKTGKKTLDLNYKQDTLNGPYTSWYPNGGVKEQGQYADNNKINEWVTYNPNGNILQKTTY